MTRRNRAHMASAHCGTVLGQDRVQNCAVLSKKTRTLKVCVSSPADRRVETSRGAGQRVRHSQHGAQCIPCYRSPRRHDNRRDPRQDVVGAIVRRVGAEAGCQTMQVHELPQCHVLPVYCISTDTDNTVPTLVEVLVLLCFEAVTQSGECH